MELVKIGSREYFVANSKEGFSGWEIFAVEKFKPGVKRLHIMRNLQPDRAEYRMVYCNDEHVPTEFRKVCA